MTPRTLLWILQTLRPSVLVKLARHKKQRGGKRKTYAEIGATGGLHPKQIQRMVKVDDWLKYEGCAVEKMLRLFAGCSVEPLHLKSHLRFMRKTRNLTTAEHVRFPQGRPTVLSKRMREVRRHRL